MAASRGGGGRRFRIRPVEEAPATRERIEEPELVPDEPPVPPPEPPPPRRRRPRASAGDTHTAGRFRSAQSVLSFLGAVAGAGLAAQAHARRGPDDQWWTEVEARWEDAAALCSAAGGKPYAGSPDKWVALAADGSGPVSRRGRKQPRKGEVLLVEHEDTERLSPAEWADAGLEDLVAAAALRKADLTPLDEAYVLAPGSLARVIVQRCLQRSFEVELTPCRREPLAGGDVEGAVLLRIRHEGGVSTSFLRSLARLPATILARPLAAHDSGDPESSTAPALLIDVRHQIPLATTLLSALLPPGEHWMLGGPDVGHWRIVATGGAVDGSRFVRVDVPIAKPSALGGGLDLEGLERETVRLVPGPPGPGHPDLLLLDDRELEWLRALVVGIGVADNVLLVPGDGRHLLAAAGKLLESVPFGLALRRVGPGGLFVEEGQRFAPPLAEAARGRSFQCGEDHLITVTRADDSGTLRAERYSLDDMVPLWTLWIDEPPRVVEATGGRGAARLGRIAEQLKSNLPKKQNPLRRALKRVRTREDPADLLTDALRARNRGDLIHAAELFEQAGELGEAAVLFERAARREGS